MNIGPGLLDGIKLIKMAYYPNQGSPYGGQMLTGFNDSIQSLYRNLGVAASQASSGYNAVNGQPRNVRSATNSQVTGGRGVPRLRYKDMMMDRTGYGGRNEYDIHEQKQPATGPGRNVPQQIRPGVPPSPQQGRFSRY